MRTMNEEGESKKRNWLLTGGLGAAFLGSLCCIGPAVFIALGLGSFSAGAFFESIRPWMGGLAIIALVFAWRQGLHKKPCLNEACEVRPKRDKGQIAMLSIGTLLAIGLLAYPYISERILEMRNADLIEEVDGTTRSTISIPSMDCAACAVGIQSQLVGLEGIESARITYESKLAQIVYDSRQITETEILKTIEATGFPAKEIQPNENHVQ